MSISWTIGICTHGNTVAFGLIQGPKVHLPPLHFIHRQNIVQGEIKLCNSGGNEIRLAREVKSRAVLSRT